MRYRAFGADRYTWGTTPTTYRFTGQRSESAIGLYYYNARWYDPALARFAQADTIQPNPGDPQQLNRFSYTRNNPVRYSDPTGHYVFEEGPNDGEFIPPSSDRPFAQRTVSIHRAWIGSGKKEAPPPGWSMSETRRPPGPADATTIALDAGSTIFGFVALGCSAAGVAAEILGGPPGIAAYAATLNWIEGGAGALSTGLTVASDFRSGNGIAFDCNESGFRTVSMGHDSFQSVATSTIGAVWPEAAGDTALNLIGVASSGNRLLSDLGMMAWPNSRVTITTPFQCRDP